jgi:uncharacterized PurR-regulated membrane protein YhhQ (DUF165 family)
VKAIPNSLHYAMKSMLPNNLICIIHFGNITSRKYGKKESQSFVQCGFFYHLNLQSLNDCKSMSNQIKSNQSQGGQRTAMEK